MSPTPLKHRELKKKNTCLFPTNFRDQYKTNVEAKSSKNAQIQYITKKIIRIHVIDNFVRSL